jgi:hypothetical protein
MAQAVGMTTTYLALDILGLAEVIYTGDGSACLHLPGVLVAMETGQTRYLLGDGQLALKAEHPGQVVGDATHAWLTMTRQSGYTGSAHLRAMPDTGRLVASAAVTAAPRLEYPLVVTTPGTYTVWVRGNPADAAGDLLPKGGAGGAGGRAERFRAGRLDPAAGGNSCHNDPQKSRLPADCT